MTDQQTQERKPGVCIPWQEKRKELSKTPENEELVQRIWEGNDALGYAYIWYCLLAF